MTKIEIDIDDILSQDEIKTIVTDHIKATLSNDKERILSNICYHLGDGYIDSVLTDEDKIYVKQKTNEILRTQSKLEYRLFAGRDVWDPSNKRIVSEIMEQAIKDNIGIIQSKTVAAMNNIDIEMLREHLENNLTDIIMLLLEKIKK